MSTESQGPGWWLASDGRWYPPEQQPGVVATAAPSPPATTYVQAAPRQTSGLAIASLVLSIIWVLGLGSLLAVIFGFVARKDIKRSAGLKGGDGLAVAGIVIGIVGLVGAIFTIVGIASAANSINTTLNRVAACESDARTVDIAVTAYMAQNPGRTPQTPVAWRTALVPDYLEQWPSGSGYSIWIAGPNAAPDSGDSVTPASGDVLVTNLSSGAVYDYTQTSDEGCFSL